MFTWKSFFFFYKSPLSHATEPFIAKLLIKAGSNVNAVDENGYTPLHQCVAKGLVEVASVLIENGANVNAVDVHKVFYYFSKLLFILPLEMDLNN
jgi:ankyrin repeat protein